MHDLICSTCQSYFARFGQIDRKKKQAYPLLSDTAEERKRKRKNISAGLINSLFLVYLPDTFNFSSGQQRRITHNSKTKVYTLEAFSRHTPSFCYPPWSFPRAPERQDQNPSSTPPMQSDELRMKTKPLLVGELPPPFPGSCTRCWKMPPKRATIGL